MKHRNLWSTWRRISICKIMEKTGLTLPELIHNNSKNLGETFLYECVKMLEEGCDCNELLSKDSK